MSKGKKLVSGPVQGSFSEQDSDDKINSDGKAAERIDKVFGQFITFLTDWDATVDFHGLPDSMRRDEEDDEKPKIWLPENFMEKQTELEKWERIYVVHRIGPEVWEDGEEPWFQEGDHVMLAGTISRKLSNPTIWIAGKGNVVALVNVKGSKIDLIS